MQKSFEVLKSYGLSFYYSLSLQINADPFLCKYLLTQAKLQKMPNVTKPLFTINNC